MIEYGESYNKIFSLYSKLINEYGSFFTIREEIKMWLVNEREKKGNPIQVSELISFFDKVFEYGNFVKNSTQYIDCCSFNLDPEYVQHFKRYLNTSQIYLNIESVGQIGQYQQFIETEIEKAHMERTYVVKPFNEVLMNFSETDFKETLTKNIIVLRNKINELRYTAPRDENTHTILEKMLYDISGLEYTQKHIHKYYQGEKHINEADLDKHISIENALVESLVKLKQLQK